MSFTEDFTEFFDTDDFADAGIYSPAAYASVHNVNGSSKSRTVSGIFTDAGVSVLDGQAYPASFNCATADVSDASDGAKLTVNDVVYTIRNTPKDGTGESTLILEKDA